MSETTEQGPRGVTSFQFKGVEHKLWAAEAPETAWVSDGTVHGRRQLFRNTFEGVCGEEPCTMDVPIVGNFDVDEKTGDGHIYGTFQYISDNGEFKWGDRVGVFDLVFWGVIDSGVGRLEFVGLGSGDFSGMLMRGVMVSPSDEPDAAVDATIHDHGRG